MSHDYYRLHLRVTPAYVERMRRAFGMPTARGETREPERAQRAIQSDLARRLGVLGATEALAVIQDATDAATFTAIVRWPAIAYAQAHGTKSDDALSIVRVEPVAAPPPRLTRKGVMIPWDHGLSHDEVSAVEHMLLTERNPRHLHGYAATLEPFFPVAATVLDAKGDLVEQKMLMDRAASRELEASVLQSSLDPNLAAAIVRERDRLAGYARRLNLPPSVVREEVKSIVCGMNDPNSARRPNLNAAIPLARLLLRQIRFRDRSLRVACPYAARLAFPPDITDGLISPSAVQLALATQKPKMAGVTSAGLVPGRMREFDQQKLPLDVRLLTNVPLALHESKFLRVKSQLERARQAIERRRWIDWYRRRQRAGYDRDVA